MAEAKAMPTPAGGGEETDDINPPTLDIQSVTSDEDRKGQGTEDTDVIDEKEQKRLEDEMKARMKTKGIDKDLLVGHLKSLYTFKVLLLGAGETGKSTIVKQLKNIHRFRRKKADLDHVALSLHQNTVDCMRSLILALEPFGLQNTIDDDLQGIITLINGLNDPMDSSNKLNEEQAKNLQKLWRSQAIQSVFKHRAEYWLLDSCAYYMENIVRFAQEDFVPTEEDILRARIRTTGITVCDFLSRYVRVDAEEPPFLTIKVVDVGGQRNERKKWIHCFDDVKCVLFLASLAEYSQVLFEDQTRNRLQESLDLFRSTVKLKMFKDTPFVLFLNKKDIFEQMIKKNSLKSCFPDYKGDNTYQSAFAFIKQKFREQLPPGKELMKIYDVSGVTRRDIKDSFQQVKKLLLSKYGDQMRKDRAKVHFKLQKLRKKRKCQIL